MDLEKKNFFLERCKFSYVISGNIVLVCFCECFIEVGEFGLLLCHCSLAGLSRKEPSCLNSLSCSCLSGAVTTLVLHCFYCGLCRAAMKWLSGLDNKRAALLDV